jgi:hypothetical protein
VFAGRGAATLGSCQGTAPKQDAEEVPEFQLRIFLHCWRKHHALSPCLLEIPYGLDPVELRQAMV